MKVRGASRLVIIAVVVSLAACVPGGKPPPAVGDVSVRNIDGPVVTVRVAGKELGRVACQSSITVDEAAAGPLPWDIELIATDGSIFGTVHETADSFLGYVTVRADGVVAGDAPAIGPAPVGCP